MRVGTRNPLQRWWWRLDDHMRARVWPLAFAALALLGLLLAFHDVVSGAVRQGEVRRAAVAAHELATWRCSMLPGTAPRSHCLAALDEAPRVELVVLDDR